MSILLVFFNQAHLSLLCLESIVEHASDVEVIIVDNHSTDETARLLDLISGAKLIKNRDNLGFVKAVNQGAALASAQQLLLLNNDARLEQGAIEFASETLESQEDIGAVGGKILLLDGTLQEAGSLIWQDGSCWDTAEATILNNPNTCSDGMSITAPVHFCYFVSRTMLHCRASTKRLPRLTMKSQTFASGSEKAASE